MFFHWVTTHQQSIIKRKGSEALFAIIVHFIHCHSHTTYILVYSFGNCAILSLIIWISFSLLIERVQFESFFCCHYYLLFCCLYRHSWRQQSNRFPNGKTLDQKMAFSLSILSFIRERIGFTNATMKYNVQKMNIGSVLNTERIQLISNDI